MSSFTKLDLNNITAIRILGKGATGTVFLAATSTTTTIPPLPPFALKVIQKHNEHHAQNELSILSLLLSSPHPLLPSLLGFLEAPSILAFALPFCPAGDLNSLRRSLPEQTFSPAAIRFYLAELVVALSHLHSLGVAYRDLKPENVLLQSNGHVLLSDFDLSRRVERGKKPPLGKSATRVSPKQCSFVGTEEYVAPETLRGDGDGFSVDWWALGVLAYETSYGRTPFCGRSREETFENVLTRQPEFVGKGCGELTDLMRRLLAKKPKERLGVDGGFEEVKGHRFFDGLKWDLVVEVCRPPFLATAEEVEEGEVVTCEGGFDVRDYFERARKEEAAVDGLSLSAMTAATTVLVR